MSDGRITGRTLQTIRSQWLYANPLCVRCLAADRVTVATELDHIIPLCKGGPDFDADDERNRQGLCRACHDAKTREDMGWKPPPPAIGIDGRPLSPGHHWNAVKP